MGNADGDGSFSAGQGCPALGDYFGGVEGGQPICESVGGAQLGDLTSQHRAVLVRVLTGASVPSAKGGPVMVAVLALLKCAAVLLVGAGVVQGYGDGDEFNEVGCTVAHHHRGDSHGSQDGGEGEKPGPKGAGGGGSGGWGPDDVPSVMEMFSQLLRGIAGVREDFVELRTEFVELGTECVELRTAKQRLEGMLADGMFAFTRKVDARSFKILCTILAEGDVAKASRRLDMPDASVRTIMRRWREGGKEYRAMLELVRWRKKVGRKETVPLNVAVLQEKTEATDYPGLLSDVLDGLLSMTDENWQARCEELSEALRIALRS